MSAKEIAIQDIKQDLERQHKCFIAFRSELDPAIDKLVNRKLYIQSIAKKKTHNQLVAHCFFSFTTGEVNFENYIKYYNGQ